jgi:hypothetical protein
VPVGQDLKSIYAMFAAKASKGLVPLHAFTAILYDNFISFFFPWIH